MKSLLLTFGIVAFVVAIIASGSPSPASPPLTEQQKAFQRYGSQISSAQIEEMKRTAERTKTDFKDIWGMTVVMMACSAKDPVACPQTNRPSRFTGKVPCSFRSPGATYECWDEKTHKMRH
jgi:hypothetical protein